MRTLALSIILLLAPTARADDPPQPKPAPPPSKAVQAFLKEWSAGMKDVRTLRVAFIQTKKLRFLRRPLKSKGVTLLKGRRVLMTVNDQANTPQLKLQVDKGEAKLYYPRLKRLEIYALGAGRPPPSPFPLFGSDLDQLPQQYDLSLAAAKAKDKRILVLKPKDPTSPIAVTWMWFKGTTITQVMQKSRKGDRVTLMVTAFERNPELKDAELELVVPKGTKTIRVAAPAKKKAKPTKPAQSSQ